MDFQIRTRLLVDYNVVIKLRDERDHLNLFGRYAGERRKFWKHIFS